MSPRAQRTGPIAGDFDHVRWSRFIVTAALFGLTILAMAVGALLQPAPAPTAAQGTEPPFSDSCVAA